MDTKEPSVTEKLLKLRSSVAVCGQTRSKSRETRKRRLRRCQQKKTRQMRKKMKHRRRKTKI